MKHFNNILIAILGLSLTNPAIANDYSFIENWLKNQEANKIRFIEYNPESNAIDFYHCVEKDNGQIYNEFRHQQLRPQNPALLLLIGSILTTTTVAGSSIYGINKLKNYLISKCSPQSQEYINSGALISEIILAGGGAITIAGIITLYREYGAFLNAGRELILKLNTPVMTFDKTGLHTNGLHKNEKTLVNWQNIYDIQEKSDSFLYVGKDGNMLFDTKLYTQDIFVSTHALLNSLAPGIIYDIPFRKDQKSIVSEQDLNALIQHYLEIYGNETIKEKLKTIK